jgi:hypothetical protein
MMKWAALALPVALVVLAAAPASAQTHRSALGLSAGWSTAGDLTPGLDAEGTMEAGWTAGAQLELWAPGRRLGVRLNASVAERRVEGTQRTFRIPAADLGLVARLLPARHDRPFAPFVALGAGPVFYMASDPTQPLGDGFYGQDPVLRWMVAPSVGVDLHTRSRVGLRLEAADQIVFPAIGESPDAFGVPRVHHPGARVALQLRMGRARPAATVLRMAPPPTAASLYSVQIGVVADVAAADDLARRLEGVELPLWFTETTASGRRLTIVRVGVVDSAEDARMLARRLREDFGFSTTVVTLPPDHEAPAEAVVQTLRFLFPG